MGVFTLRGVAMAMATHSYVLCIISFHCHCRHKWAHNPFTNDAIAIVIAAPLSVNTPIGFLTTYSWRKENIGFPLPLPSQCERALTIPVFLLLPQSPVHKFNVFIIQIKLTNEARNSVNFTIIVDGPWRESLKIVFRSWGSNGKRKSIQKLKDKHNVVQQDTQSEFLLSSLIFSLTFPWLIKNSPTFHRLSGQFLKFPDFPWLENLLSFFRFPELLGTLNF